MRNIKTREGYDLWDKFNSLPSFQFWRGGEDEKGSVIRVEDKNGAWFHRHALEELIDAAQDDLNLLRERLARLAPAEVVTPAFDEAAERAAFEEVYHLWDLDKDPLSGAYLDTQERLMWDGWLNCAKRKAGGDL